MAWCFQTKSPYLSQCRPIPMSPYVMAWDVRGICATCDLSPKSHNASDKYPKMHHFVTEMWKCAYYCYKVVHCWIWEWCLVGFVSDVQVLLSGVVQNVLKKTPTAVLLVVFNTYFFPPQLMRDADYVTRSAFEQFAIAYMTSVTMTVLNAILPTFFKKIVKFEDYAPGFENNMTLFR